MNDQDARRSRLNANYRKWYSRHKAAAFWASIKKRYGVSRERFDAMIVFQCGLCDICLEPMANPCIDHNHATGEVRSLLCQPCNAAIGLLRENADIIDRAKNYILKFQK